MRQKCQFLIYHSGSTYREESGFVSQVSAQAVIGKVTLSMLDIAGLSSASSAYVLFLPTMSPTRRVPLLQFASAHEIRKGNNYNYNSPTGLINLKTRKKLN